MKKRFLLLTPVLLALVFLISSCDTTTDPGPIEETGSILIQTTPPGATIWVDGNNTGKTTPDSVTALSTGDHIVTLTLDGYKDTTLTVNVVANFQRSIAVDMVSDLNLTLYGTVRLWETTGTTVDQPSGLDLSSGMAYAVSGADNDKIDLFYYTNSTFTVHEIRSADQWQNLPRESYFKISSFNVLDDGTDSPAVDGTWVQSFSDTEQNYVFIYDEDGHYSKLIITAYGGGIGTEPAWVDVQWYYNENAGDQRF